MLPSVYVPSTPYISNSGTPLISKIYFTVHDSAHYAYWLRFGWCYANPAKGGPCAADYNPSGSGQWIPFVELSNQDGDALGGTAAYSTPGGQTLDLAIAYSTGEQFTNLYLGNVMILQVWTKFSANGFKPIDTGGATSISNANPAHGDAVWMGGLGTGNAANLFDIDLCHNPTGDPSVGCTYTYWNTGYPDAGTIKYPPTCNASPCPYDWTANTPGGYYSFLYWTKPY